MTGRPRIRRASLTWFYEARPTDKHISFTFEAGAGALIGSLSRWEINVGAEEPAGEWWDIIFSHEASPQRVEGGSVCDLCLSEFKQAFPTREARPPV